MRRITLAIVGTISGLILLFSYHTSTNSPGGQATTAGGSTEDTGTTSSNASTAGASTYTGDEANTQWGIVEVQITVANGKITKSEAVEAPSGNPRDQEINAYAVPQLNSEAVAAQSSSIDAVSGATVTSDGYIQSLQSAIDKANL